MVCVDLGDENSAVDKVWKDEKFTQPVAYSAEAVGNKYNAITPTNYLIDPSGKIVKAKLGFDEAELRKSLASLGVQ